MRGAKSTYTYVPKAEYERRMKEWRAAVARVRAHNAGVAGCVDNRGIPTCNQFSQNLPTGLNLRIAGEPADTPPAGVTAEDLAYMAVAELTLSPPRPMIGPPPTINEWKMAAVGYPMWLWAEGTLDPPPVADSVYNVAVSLDARLERVVFDMGDGHRVSCTDLTRRWHRGITPAAKSPTCGYTYQQPSLPDGDYTITAHAVWAIDWTINATRGTIPLYQTATTQLPVGELQVLVR